MAITRRDFLKYSAATGAGVLFGVFDLKPIVAYALASAPAWVTQAISVCGYCSVGCSMVVGSIDGSKVTNGIAGKKYVTYVQGNPDSPINTGSLCSKGSASAQLSTIVSTDSGKKATNPERLTQPLYRAPGSSSWTPISWTTAMSQIATKVYNARKLVADGGTLVDVETEIAAAAGTHLGPDSSANLIDSAGRNFTTLGVTVGMTVKNTTDGSSGIVTEISSTHVANDTLKFADGLIGGTEGDWDTGDSFKVYTLTVNRCTGIASLGAAALNNEACYMITKLMRSLGVVYLEHQARV